MKLYDTDYNTISPDDNEIWEQLKEKEIVYDNNGKPTMIRKSLRNQYPQAVRHYISLFPNNFLDAVELRTNEASMTVVATEFSKLILDSETTERDILNFITSNKAYFIIGSKLNDFRFGHHALYLFPEFQLGTEYKADYLLVGGNSDGCHFVFVEFENPYKSITTQSGDYGTTIRKGVSQVKDWQIWLESNFPSLENEFKKSLINASTPLSDEFRRYDSSRIYYVVVAGRRDDFNEKTRRLRRQDSEQSKIHIIHYDHLIDCVNSTIGKKTY